jgi:hypothetical protein
VNAWEEVRSWQVADVKQAVSLPCQSPSSLVIVRYSVVFVEAQNRADGGEGAADGGEGARALFPSSCSHQVNRTMHL